MAHGPSATASKAQFAGFELDFRSAELARNGRRVRLQDQPFRVLKVLLENAGAVVSRDELQRQLWPQETFVDFDHGLNKAIGKLRDALDNPGSECSLIETLPRRGYRLAVEVQWTELARTPVQAAEAPVTIPVPQDGKISTQDEAHRAPTARRLLSWRFVTVTLVFLMAVGAVVKTAQTRRIAESASPIRSIAILPLENLSGDPNQEYFADGMTEELTTALAKDSNLQIVSRTSVMQYKKVHKPLPEIARALHVDAIVEGAAARSGDKVHMTLQLIRGDTDSHVWAESYDRDADDAVALPGEAARAIATRLDSAVASRPAAAHVDPAAHDALLQGKYLWFNDESVSESGKYFQKAIQIQPDYALGWAWLANYYGAATDAGELDPRQSLKLLEEAANEAMQLDPNLAESHQAMAWNYLFGRWDLASADRELLQAISLDPNDAKLYHLRAELLGMLNRHEEAIQSEKKAMELDPFGRPWGLVLAYSNARQYDAAIADGELRRKNYPNDFTLLLLMTFAYLEKHMDKEAVNTWILAKEAHGQSQEAAAFRRAYQEGGTRALWQFQLSHWEMYGKKNYVSPVFLAAFHAKLGEADKAVSLLEEAYQQRAPDVLRIQMGSAFDSLHADPRYRALVQRISLPPAY